MTWGQGETRGNNPIELHRTEVGLKKTVPDQLTSPKRVSGIYCTKFVAFVTVQQVILVKSMLELVLELDVSVAGHPGEIWTESWVSFRCSIFQTRNEKHGQVDG